MPKVVEKATERPSLFIRATTAECADFTKAYMSHGATISLKLTTFNVSQKELDDLIHWGRQIVALCTGTVAHVHRAFSSRPSQRRVAVHAVHQTVLKWTSIRGRQVNLRVGISQLRELSVGYKRLKFAPLKIQHQS